MTRPQRNLRARRAMMALGALCPAISIAVPMATAQSRTTVARAADVAPHRSTLNVMAGRRATVAGHVSPGIAGRHVALQRRGAKHHWNTIDHATTTAGGAFAFRFRPQHAGSARLRVAVDSAKREIGRLNVYRRAAVSWYGPGLYGNKLSCGGRLTPGTLGVANKTRPCGSRVTLRRGDHIVRVPVVDRGPYGAGREFDLTAATREKLHFGGVGTVLVAG